MKRLILLGITAFLSLNAFSQNVTAQTDSVIVLSYRVAKLVAEDLITGDIAKETVEMQEELIQRQESVQKLNEDLIQNLQTKLRLQEKATAINEVTLESLDSQVQDLIQDLGKREKALKVYKTTTALSTAAFILALIF